jgi:C4-dicarboxylate-specific signal transduction histidine kinase
VIEHLRRFARGVEQGAQPVPVPVREAVDGAMALIGGGLRDAGIELVLELGAPPPVVRGHLVALEQVLGNLLMNARDAMAQLPEGRPRRLHVRAEHADAAEMVRLTVADTGGGLPEEVLGRLFEPFVTTKGPERGTGLGLSICHGLVQGMGGSISAANDNQGAVFTLLLPAANAPGGAATGPSVPPAAGGAALQLR